ncbi:hypothetical protein EW145_g1006 [Phellinidium pouzarii]|uniref:Uncharacterized protein n=1 Tax=Phellinidium pouzarii TaxID=167371 RepID=A0A4S4LLQ8_9AGAM|nr:hypothetical protein EW145_g1006 [Phellinidium pouzarii]
MLNSSPFRASHRRSRSHSSPSAPNSSPTGISRHDDLRAQAIRSPAFIKTKTSAVPPFPSSGSAFVAQPPKKWDVEAWRRGKRARREPSVRLLSPHPSRLSVNTCFSQSPSDDADMESCDEPMPSSPVAAPILLDNTTSTSAPSTPHLPSTSDAFQLFQSKASTASNDAKPAMSMFSTHTHISTDVDSDCHDAGLAQLHSDAFSDLRRTVVEAGEGFVRRMREFEADRTRAGLSRVGTHLPLSDRKDLHYKRGRKRPSPISTRHLIQPPPAGTPAAKSAQSQEDEDAKESDVEFRSSYASGSDDYSSWSPSKKRAVSLDALYNKGLGAQQQSYSLPYPIPLRRREQSSSPSTYADSSDEEDEPEDAVDHVWQRHPARFPSTALSVKSSTPPLSFSFSSASNNSSRVSLPAGAPSPISHTSTVKPSVGLPALSSRSSKRAEMAVAALSLAIANGAGSVSDYETLRDAQGALAMDDGEAGGLWD